jgi:hypothetical protein
MIVGLYCFAIGPRDHKFNGFEARFQLSPCDHLREILAQKSVRRFQSFQILDDRRVSKPLHERWYIELVCKRQAECCAAS